MRAVCIRLLANCQFQLVTRKQKDMQYNGFVSLVGAGPGDADLLTVKALRLLKQADVVVFDRLVSSDILELIPAGVGRNDIGRSGAVRLSTGKESNRKTADQSGKLVDVAHAGRGDITIHLAEAEGLAPASPRRPWKTTVGEARPSTFTLEFHRRGGLVQGV